MRMLRALMLLLILSGFVYAGEMPNEFAGNMPCEVVGEMPTDKAATSDGITATVLQLMQSVLPLF